MEDENEVQSPIDENAGSPSVITEAERRRQERRRKILQNQESRLKKILGPSASSKDIERIVGSSASPDNESIESAADVDLQANSSLPSVFRPFEPATASTHSHHDEIRDTLLEETPVSNIQATFGTPKSNIEEGTLPIWIHHLILCALGVFLPLLNLRYFLVYFFMWQLTVWKVFKGLQQRPSSPNLLFALILVMGLREGQSARLQMIICVAGALWLDFCLLFMSCTVSQILFCEFAWESQQTTFGSPGYE